LGIGQQVVDVDDAIEVVCDGLGDSVELLEVVFPIGDEGGESRQGKVVHGSLIGGRAVSICASRIV
jgi:hypothetical protein